MVLKGWTDAELHEFAAAQLHELGDEGLIIRPAGISEKRFERILSSVLFARKTFDEHMYERKPK